MADYNEDGDEENDTTWRADGSSGNHPKSIFFLIGDIWMKQANILQQDTYFLAKKLSVWLDSRAR